MNTFAPKIKPCSDGFPNDWKSTIFVHVLSKYYFTQGFVPF